MGFFDRFRRRPKPTAPMHVTPPEAPVPLAPVRLLPPVPPRRPAAAPPVATATVSGFAVIDVETTGLSPNSHRILELAIVRTDPAGRVVDEWVCRFNPGGR